MFNNIGFVSFAGLEETTTTQNANGGFEVTTSGVEVSSTNTTDNQIGKENNSEAAKETWTYRTAIYPKYETEDTSAIM
jgi:hypothetical protein